MTNKFIKSLSIALLAILLTGCTEQMESQSTVKTNETEVIDDNIQISTDISDSPITDYLKTNSYALSSEPDDFTGLDAIDFSNKSIIFTAEGHGTQSNNILKMKFIKYLKRELDFNYLLCETSVSSAHYINEYLDTGDESILEELYVPLKGTFAWNKQSYNDWIKLYDFNSLLPDNEKIEVVGVDLEHQPYTAFRYLTDIIPPEEPPIEIISIIDEIYTTFNKMPKNSYLPPEALQTSENIRNALNEYDTVFQNYLGENYLEFKLVNQNILNIDKARQNRNYMTWNQTRDKMIYDNFQIIESELDNGIFYGQWGLNHTFQSKERHVMWFAGYLNDDGSKYAEKVLSIVFNYTDSSRIEQEDNSTYSFTDFELSFPFIKDEYMSCLDLENDLTLIKLDNSVTNRPLIEMKEWNSGIPLGKDVSDFFQYVILIKNSEAVDPLIP